ncbi:MAG: peptidylprolyl isomerase [Methanomicrobiaceae archaeon]|nr:peptidylprolyl isomerase [Methanomicrobiaceae archaeon]
MAQAKNGDTVKVHYTGRLEDGTVFDSSYDREPLQFTLGDGQVIQGFEEAIVGMNPGEKKTARVPADEAYGHRREDMMITADRNQLPEDFEPEVGQQLQILQSDGQVMVVTVREVTGSTVTLDANHPLAGMDLMFDIQLVEIE